MTIARSDLLVEIDTTFDASGNYTGPWMDSTGILSVRGVYSFSGSSGPQVFIEESSDASVVLGGGGSIYGGAVVPLSARYFRVAGTGADAGATLRASIRRVS